MRVSTGILAAFSTSIVGAAGRAQRPNILFVVADDYGWNDVGYHTDPTAQGYLNTANPHGRPTTNAAAGVMETPTIDRLADEGVKLESYYVQPLCSPTRSTFMTGRYASHTGVGPNVIVIDEPYGVPARETFLPELLKRVGYSTHAVGKWHLGACDNRYEATYRGFDSFMGYLAGAEDYYNHQGDFRNGSGAGVTPWCMGAAVSHNYSSLLFADEASRIARAHDPSVPLFMYLAFQSVHNPYDDPTGIDVPGTDVNESFPEIHDHTRRIYAGMVAALDAGVAAVEQAYKDAGLWDDTVTVFTTDNGGIEYGNNYPLRGAKVLLWEGGIRGVAWVRGSKAFPLATPGGHTSALMHSTDWLPTLCGIAGAPTDGTLPLDGHNQWPVLSRGEPTTRTTIFHNVPVGAAPVLRPNGAGVSTTACMSLVDNRTGSCAGFGLTGGALRKNEWKLLTTFPGDHPWGDSAPEGTGQYTPGGRYPNGSSVFVPVTNDTTPDALVINETLAVFLFNISADPTESNNLASAEPAVLKDMLETYSQYATTAVTPLGFRWGFKDPKRGNSMPRPGEARCQGQFAGSSYCAYGAELDCVVKGRAIAGDGAGGDASARNSSACHASCAGNASWCDWWSLAASTGCRFFTGGLALLRFDDCGSPDACSYGAAACEYGRTAHDPFPGPAKPPPPPPCASNSTSCFVKGQGLAKGECCVPGGIVAVAADDAACQAACQAHSQCSWWVRRGTECHLKSFKGTPYSSGGVDYGPRCCPPPAPPPGQQPAWPREYIDW